MTLSKGQTPPHASIAVITAFGQDTRISLDGAAAAAYEMHRAGLNPFPQPYAGKRGYPWLPFKGTRLDLEAIPLAFGGAPCNVAVMTGRTSGNLIDLDCETAAEFARRMAQASWSGLALWAYRTRRGGHIWFRCSEGELRNVKALKALEVRASGCYVIAPPSVYTDPDTGEIHDYEWVMRQGDQPPAVSLDRLRDAFGDIPFAYVRSGARLSANSRTFLSGLTLVGTRNNQAFTTACELFSRGFDYTYVEQTITAGARACGLTTSEAHAIVKSAQDTADKHSTTHSGPQPATAASLAALWATTRPWPGRTGSTDRAVFLAHVTRAQVELSLGVTSWRATERELGELARCKHETARKATQRLVSTEALVIAQRSRTRGNRYRFGRAVLVGGVNGPLVVTASIVGRLRPFENDAFEHKALGKSASYVLDTLANNPLITIARIAELSGLTSSQARTGARALRDAGIAAYGPHGWALCCELDFVEERLQDTADITGAAGAGERRKVQHEHERARRALRMVLTARRALTRPDAY